LPNRGLAEPGAAASSKQLPLPEEGFVQALGHLAEANRAWAAANTDYSAAEKMCTSTTKILW
jgi:hypothetical protein